MDGFDTIATDAAGQATVALLEARLRRLEHLLYGPTLAEDVRSGAEPVTAAAVPATPTLDALEGLERRFVTLVAGARVYGELLRIYHAHPSLFQSPPAGTPPTQLDTDALRAAVLSYASAFPATASALSAAAVDTPVPDAALSAQLVQLVPRMQAAAARQAATNREVAALRRRSEALVRQFYERRALAPTEAVAGAEARLARVEGQVRRRERAAEDL